MEFQTSCRAIAVLTLTLLAACGTEAPRMLAAPAADATMTSTVTVDGGQEAVDSGTQPDSGCAAGTEGCLCRAPTATDTACDEGLSCLSRTCVMISDAGVPMDAGTPAPDATAFPDADLALPDAMVLPDAASLQDTGTEVDAGLVSPADSGLAIDAGFGGVSDASPAPDAAAFSDAAPALPDATVLPLDSGPTIDAGSTLDSGTMDSGSLAADAAALDATADSGPADIGSGSASSDAGVSGVSRIRWVHTTTSGMQWPAGVTQARLMLECRRGPGVTVDWPRVTTGYATVTYPLATGTVATMSYDYAGFQRGDWCKVNPLGVDVNGNPVTWAYGWAGGVQQAIGQVTATGATNVVLEDNHQGGFDMVIRF